MHDSPSRAQLLQQPRAVWAVAFACVVAFMGIGLVDPILPAIARGLKASPSQVELLFTSYLLVTGLAMVVTGAVASWIGPKATLLSGLFLIVVFASLAGSSSTIAQVVGFRAGWGLGNALFIATALAVIVSAASGGIGGAIILYEAALGLGIAVGPVVGGILGGITWRGPFYGTAVLMSVALLAILIWLPATPRPALRVPVLAPIRALRHSGLRTVGLVAFLYNFGFFVLLAYTPFPLGLDAHGLGLVFFGWGVCVALSSVLIAPRLEAAFRTLRTVVAMLVVLALILLLMGLMTQSRPALIALVVVAGLFLGVNNTLITQAVMRISPFERPVASAGYSFIRFMGGAIAPFLAGKLAERFGSHVPFYVASTSVLMAIVVIAWGRRQLAPADQPMQVARADNSNLKVPGARTTAGVVTGVLAERD